MPWVENTCWPAQKYYHFSFFVDDNDVYEYCDWHITIVSFSGNTMGFIAPQITGILTNVVNEISNVCKCHLVLIITWRATTTWNTGEFSSVSQLRYLNLFSQHKETDNDLLPFFLSVNHLSLFQKTSIINHISFQVYTIGNAVFVMFGTSKEQKWNRRQGSQYQWSLAVLVVRKKHLLKLHFSSL